MRRIVLVFLLAAASIITACKQPEQRKETSAPELLRSVPADASGVLYCAKYQDGLQAFLDSADVFNLLDAGKYRNSEAVLSYHYNGEIFRLLSLELGKADTDTTDTVQALKSQADSLKLRSRFFSADNPVGRPLLLLSNSQAVLESAARHMSVGTSVLDATGIYPAIGKTSGLKAWALLKNKDCGKLIGTGYAGAFASRKDAVGFLNQATEWTVICRPSADNTEIMGSQPEDFAFYMSFLNSRTPAESLLGGALPQDCTFALALPIASADEYIKAHDNWLDAKTLLSKYKADSKAAEQWLKESGLKEIAAVQRGEEKLVLLRINEEAASKALQDGCTFFQYTEKLFGSMFRISQDAACEKKAEWLVCGESNAVQAFLEQEPLSRKNWPQKAVAVMLLPQTYGVVGAIGTERGIVKAEGETVLAVIDKDKMRYGVSVTE